MDDILQIERQTKTHFDRICNKESNKLKLAIDAAYVTVWRWFLLYLWITVIGYDFR